MKISEFLKETLVDYEGKHASEIFTADCNLRCHACHAKKIVFGDGKINESEILRYLDSSKDWVDGFVFCGGEPTIQPGLGIFARKIKKIIPSVKLDTNGSNPRVLQGLLEEKLFDYVAMDIKGPSYLYNKLIGRRIDLRDNVEKGMVMTTRFPNYEFRTTVAPVIRDNEKNEISWMTIEEAVDMAKWIVDNTRGNLHKHYLQSFVARSKEEMIDERFSKENLSPEMHKTPDKLMKNMQRAISKYLPNCKIRD